MTDSLDPRTLVNRLLDWLADSYVFPERAATVEQLCGETSAREVRGAGRRGTLRAVERGPFEASRDKHLRLIWHPADRNETPARRLS